MLAFPRKGKQIQFWKLRSVKEESGRQVSQNLVSKFSEASVIPMTSWSLVIHTHTRLVGRIISWPLSCSSVVSSASNGLEVAAMLSLAG